MSKTETGPSVAEIEAQLDRILASAEFKPSARLSAFLRFVVEETLAGRSAEIKGYTIAVSVFGRGSDFDPNTDPIVRVEATRLRRAVTQYYLTGGARDPVLIDLPKGSYVPVFRLRAPGEVPEPAEAGEPPSAPVPPARARDVAAWAGEHPGLVALVCVAVVGLAVLLGLAASRVTRAEPPSIAVLPFANLTGSAANDNMTRGLTIEIASELARDRGLRVFASDPLTLQELRDGGPRKAPRYVLRGSLRLSGQRLRIEAGLSDTATGQLHWSETFDRTYTVDDLLAIETEIARAIATVVTQPYGLISRLETDRTPPTVQPHTMGAYICILSAYEYWRSLDPATHAEVRDCLERATREEPMNAGAWAALTFFYLDEYRYGYNPRAGIDPRDRALTAAKRAVGLDPLSAQAHQALYGAYFYRENFLEFRRAGERALELNPNNTEIRADFGAKLCFANDFTRGLKLLRRALEENPACPGWCHIAFVYDSYRRDDYELALAHVDAMQMPGYFRTHVFRAMIYGAMGEREKAAAALGEVDRLKPDFRANAAAYLQRWTPDPGLIRDSAEGLRKAGLDVQL